MGSSINSKEENIVTVGEARADMKKKLTEIIEEIDKAEVLKDGSEEQFLADQMATIKFLILLLTEMPSNLNSYVGIVGKENEHRKDPHTGPPLKDIPGNLL